MSVQTDCEMLSIMAMEDYAVKHSITSEVAMDIFHKNQVFEKILIQHECLHQVSREEVNEYVEKIIEETSKELIVYHGSCSAFTEIDLSRSYNRRDFGKGFYTTILRK